MPSTAVVRWLYCSSFRERQHLSPTLRVFQEVGPILHYLRTPFEMEGVVVGGAISIPLGMGELQLNMLMRVWSLHLSYSVPDVGTFQRTLGCAILRTVADTVAGAGLEGFGRAGEATV